MLNLSSKFVKKHRYLFVLFVLGFLWRFFTVRVFSIDSDEVVWSVMAHNILRFGESYLYFITQNFRGALETYILLPFQFLFGFSSSILRVNSILFGTLTSLLIYKLLEENLGLRWGILGFFIYSLMLPRNLQIHAKAWGNYAFIEFALAACFYLFSVWLESRQEAISLVIGLLLAVSFWANMQSVYFVLILVLFYLFGWLISEKLRPRLCDLPLLLFSALNFYLLIRKRMIFNPLLTLNVKLGFDFPPHLIEPFNISLLYLIFAMWAYFLVWFVFWREKNAWRSSFFTVSSLFFAGAAVNIYHDSFSRISASGAGVFEMWNFFRASLVSSFLGELWPLFAFLIGAALLYRFFTFLKEKELTGVDIFLLSVFALPFMFISSGIPQLVDSPRYLIIWWVPLVMASCYGLFVISSLPRLKFLPWSVIFSCVWLGFVLTKWEGFVKMRKERISQQSRNRVLIEKIKARGDKYCVGDYWLVGPLMYEADLEVLCWTDEKLGWDVAYLNFYKEMFGDQPHFVVE